MFDEYHSCRPALVGIVWDGSEDPAKPELARPPETHLETFVMVWSRMS
jgi:hypothetical protein